MAHSRSLETMPPTLAGRHQSAPLSPVTADEDLAFNALLVPNRSLSGAGFRTVMAIVISVNLINALIYFVVGAWPVVIFCGIDIVLVWLAFRLSYAQGRRHERLILTDDALWVIRVLPSGHETRWKLTPAFVRIDIARPIEHDSQLCLRECGKTLVIGSFLAPKKRGEVAEALERVLAPRRLA